jgi:hypothetical protein
MNVVDYFYNPTYLRSRAQEDDSSKPAWVNSLRGPTWKKTFTKKGCGVAQGVGPEFKTQYCKRKKKYE